MKFQDWIEKTGGDQKVAVLLKVAPHRVRMWRRKVATPRPKVMQAIVRITKGRVGFNEIIDGTYRDHPERRSKAAAKKQASPKMKKKTDAKSKGERSSSKKLTTTKSQPKSRSLTKKAAIKLTAKKSMPKAKPKGPASVKAKKSEHYDI